MDEFVFELTRDEYLDFMFEDLELPNLVKKQLRDSESYKLIKGGYTREGIPARLNVVQSLRSAQGRRIALSGAIKRRINCWKLKLRSWNATGRGWQETMAKSRDLTARLADLNEKLHRQRRRLNQVPFLDELDLRYNHMIEEPVPSSAPSCSASWMCQDR